MKPRHDNPAIVRSTNRNLLRWSLPLLLVFCFTNTALAGEKPAHAVAPAAAQSSPAIAIGFVGGFVHPDDTRHAEVELARKLSELYGRGIHSEIFDNHHRQDAYRAIRHWLDTDEDGEVSNAERRASRIVLYGHSWGASAVLSLARELQRENIPVLLTIQVDSIHKMGQNERVVPANVAEAVNFYQTRGLLHGLTNIVAADPAHTEILGQFRFDYSKLPRECGNYPWFDRHVFKGHTAIECDPRVWSQISALIGSTLFSNISEPANSYRESPTQVPQPETVGTRTLVQQLLPSQLMQR